ncbi:MAG: hypothetical protein E7311_05355 [Clostridiales bacterium]|nr:hypothetical protein [Clostridiales bacterium]
MLLLEIVKFVFFSIAIVLISKYILVKVLRDLGEALELEATSIGNISGIATSMPELLTVCFSAFVGLMESSVYNILSSNIINFIQYLFSIFLNKNHKRLKNKAIIIDLVLVLVTIIIPILMIIFKITSNIRIVPLFIILLIYFYYLNIQAHKKYLSKEDEELKERLNRDNIIKKRKFKKIFKYTIYLILVGITLYIVGNLLSTVLTNLCNIFGVSEMILGILLGFITSIPELITFFEAQKYYVLDRNAELGVIEATNNLLTSNLFNIFVIQSLGIIIFSIVT